MDLALAKYDVATFSCRSEAPAESHQAQQIMDPHEHEPEVWFDLIGRATCYTHLPTAAGDVS